MDERNNQHARLISRLIGVDIDESTKDAGEEPKNNIEKKNIFKVEYVKEDWSWIINLED